MRWGVFAVVLLGCSPQSTATQRVGTASMQTTFSGLHAHFEVSAAAVVTPTSVRIVVTNLFIPTSDSCTAPGVVATNGPTSGTHLFTSKLTLPTNGPLHVGTYGDAVDVTTLTDDTCGVLAEGSGSGFVSIESIGDTVTGIWRTHLANDHENADVLIMFNAPVCTFDTDASAALGCTAYPRCGDSSTATCVE